MRRKFLSAAHLLALLVDVALAKEIALKTFDQTIQRKAPQSQNVVLSYHYIIKEAQRSIVNISTESKKKEYSTLRLF